MADKIYLGITAGDPNGIGMELILRSFSNKSLFDYCNPVIYTTPKAIDYYANLLELEGISYAIINQVKDFKSGKLNVKVCTDANLQITPGVADPSAGAFALSALKMAVADIKKGEIHNLLTCPIDKNSTYGVDFNFAGHTDYLAAEFESPEHMMLLVSDELKVGLVTGHIPIQDVAGALSIDKILEKIKILNHTLIQDFGVAKPKIAILGLNPHSGDNGVIGKEELEKIIPAIELAKKEDILAIGPYPADGFFGNGVYKQFDAVLAMYHDQGLIPFKQMAFFSGVNYTAGLPIIRTSPDHGTAYDIAGKGEASLESFLNALFLNNKIYKNRIDFMDLTKSPLPFTKHRREKFSIGVPVLK